ncbi:MAG: hypothetical protein K5895_03735, partial [Lachnospiraceae bacterium]|nr:hypothetical protein [Lachnospiraceae bacterium]
YNMGNGLAIEYYKNGKIKSISIIVNNLNTDSYSYNEKGELENVNIMNRNNTFGLNYSLIKDKLMVLRQKYNLEKLNVFKDYLN